MLVAYGPNGQPVVAEEIPLAQLQHWSRERALHCPNCRGVVHVRGGPDKQMQIHFAHQRGECVWSTETESVRHARGKIVLAHWLQEQFPQATVTLEERLPEPNRIADIFVAHAGGQRWAVEFQCAPLDVDEWKHRHEAYRKARVLDTWIIGDNRREKQEAFIEAILTMAREILFLDPQVTPPRTWLRWPVKRNTIQEWQNDFALHPSIEGWVGHLGYGATLSGTLQEVRMDEQGGFIHSVRSALESQSQLLQAMHKTSILDDTLLAGYMRQRVGEEAVRVVIVPLLHAYTRDPDLLRRYNYGRGQLNQTVSETDHMRVQKAKEWLATLAAKGFPQAHLQGLSKEVPFIGPYAAFARYMEMLVSLSS